MTARMKDVWLIRYPGPGYHRVLVINNLKPIFDSEDLAKEFIEQHLDPAEGHYVQKTCTFDFVKTLTAADVYFREWKQEKAVQRVLLL